MSKPSESNAVLVAIRTPRVTAKDVDSSLQELTRLVTTLGYRVVGRVTQKRSSDRYAAVLGEGKLAELARWTGGSGKVEASFRRPAHKAAAKHEAEDVDVPEESDEDESDDSLEASPGPGEQAQIVIVDCDLSPSQLKNLERAAGVPVLDRTGVIIEIFSRHARTRAARLQVEIARLNYLAPRLRETGGGSERQGGGVGGKGAGETSLELDKRRIRDRTKELRAELAAIGDEHLTRRARREHELTVALVGYTNAGKSSLMRAMTGSEVLVADKLFATLDTTIRPLYPETRPKVLLSDTVGFIKKLPHDLVASFKSTLDEALDAALLLHVIDASDPGFERQLEVTDKVLAEIGADRIPQLMVSNKIDLKDGEPQIERQSADDWGLGQRPSQAPGGAQIAPGAAFGSDHLGDDSRAQPAVGVAASAELRACCLISAISVSRRSHSAIFWPFLTISLSSTNSLAPYGTR